jgi:uncharacterized protein (TIGR03086 family)
MSVALLERAVDYTRERLAAVRPGDFAAPTPCSEWDLGDLLAHMEDSLDAFLEASRGVVGPPQATIRAPQLDRLRSKACHLLGSWAALAPGLDVVRVGDRTLPATTLLEAAALEITVHGWDVGQAIHDPAPLPRTLAEDLLPVAARVVTPDVRSGRFADPIGWAGGGAEYAPEQAPGCELLGFLGRMLTCHSCHDPR